MRFRFLFFTLIALSSLHAADSRMVFALKPDKNPEKMLAEKTSLEAFLESATGGEVEVIIPLSAAVIFEGLANGSIDAAYLSGSDMITARKRSIADLLRVISIAGKTEYRSVWLVLKESALQSVADLRGKSVAFASRTSTSGFVIPLWDLHQQGLLSKPDPETFFGTGNVFFGTGYVSAVERVLRGEAVAAAVSDYVFEKDKHLTGEQRAALRVLDDQGPVPTHGIVVSSQTDAAHKSALAKALDGLNADAQDALRNGIFGGQLVPVDADAHLSGLENALEFAQSAP